MSKKHSLLYYQTYYFFHTHNYHKVNTITDEITIDMDALSKAVAQNLKIDTQDPLVPKKKVHIKESINTGLIIWFVFGFLGFIMPQGMIKMNDFSDAGYWIAIIMIVGLFFMICKFKSPSDVIQIGIDLIVKLIDPKMTPESKIEYIKEQIEKPLIDQEFGLNSNKWKVQWRDKIPTGFFLTYVISIIIILVIGFNVVSWTNWKELYNDAWFIAICWLSGWCLLLILGWEQKGSLFYAAGNIVRVMYNPNLSAENKIAFVKDIMDKLTGMAEMLLYSKSDTEHTGISKFIIPLGRKSAFPKPKPLEEPLIESKESPSDNRIVNSTLDKPI